MHVVDAGGSAMLKINSRSGTNEGAIYSGVDLSLTLNSSDVIGGAINTHNSTFVTVSNDTLWSTANAV